MAQLQDGQITMSTSRALANVSLRANTCRTPRPPATRVSQACCSAEHTNSLLLCVNMSPVIVRFPGLYSSLLYHVGYPCVYCTKSFIPPMFICLHLWPCAFFFLFVCFTVIAPLCLVPDGWWKSVWMKQTYEKRIDRSARGYCSSNGERAQGQLEMYIHTHIAHLGCKYRWLNFSGFNVHPFCMNGIFRCMQGFWLVGWLTRYHIPFQPAGSLCGLDRIPFSWNTVKTIHKHQ